MQRLIQINIAGSIISIEEDAYVLLKDYLNSLSRQFAGEVGQEEIISDIEHRIAELFTLRLKSGSPAIDQADVSKLIRTLGHPGDLADSRVDSSAVPAIYESKREQRTRTGISTKRRLFRNPDDKILGGVCSGLANYFDIDPVIVRLTFAGMFLLLGIGFLMYIVAWIIIPVPRTPGSTPW